MTDGTDGGVHNPISPSLKRGAKKKKKKKINKETKETNPTSIYHIKNLISDTDMDKLRTYKLIKHKFELEKYLEILPDRKQKEDFNCI